MQQIFAVIRLNIETIPQRWGMSLATVLSIAIVVAVLLSFLSIAAGFQRTLAGTGSDTIALITSEGAQAELNSNIDRESFRLIETAPGVAVGPDGAPQLSAEAYVITDGTLRASGSDSNLGLRGVNPAATGFRPNFRIVEGRMFEAGAGEIIAGEGVLQEFTGFEIGRSLQLGNNEWVVVGVFTTGGTATDSEIWADLGVIQNLYQRGSSVQSVRAALAGPDSLAEIQAFIEDDPRLRLEAVTEREFFARQAGGLAAVIRFVGWPLSIAMAVGALAGAWNAMYASVDSRVRELATLRAIGFGGGSAFLGAMVESLLLSFVGGLVGAVGAWLVFDGWTASTLNAGSFTQVTFNFAVTGESVVNGVILALIVGFLGGLAPAWRAARTPLLAVHG